MPRTVNPEQHAAKRQHILDSAAVLFAQLGYERTTAAQLCRQAGVSMGTLYHYFTGKKQLFIAVLTQDEQRTRDLLQELSTSTEPLEALLTFLAHLAEPATAHPIVPQLVLEAMIQAHRDVDVRRVLADADTTERGGLRLLLGRAADAGDVDVALDLDEAAAWINTLVGALYLEAATKPDFDPTRQIHHLTRSVRTYLQAPGGDDLAR